MVIKKLLAIYTVAAMFAVVILTILWINKTFDIEPVTGVSVLALAIPVIAMAILVLREGQERL